MTPAVQVKGVTHRYGTTVALREVTFEIPPGTLFGLLGPNGGGKTTLFRILSTLIPPSEGSAAVFGADTRDQPAAVRRQIGAIFQQPALDESLSTFENLRLHGALYGLRGAALNDRIQRLLAEFGLSERTRDRVSTLSGGLLRRVDLVRGLLHQPRLLLLDEPTTGLDPVARRGFWETLGRLRREEGMTMLVATHLMDEAEACDTVGIIDRGRLAALDSPEALRASMGEETLWLETTDSPSLKAAIEARCGLTASQVGGRLQVSHAAPHTLLPALYEAAGALITSATVRKPTLEDVFLLHAGYQLGAKETEVL